MVFCFFFQAEDGIRDLVTGVQTCALPISAWDASTSYRLKANGDGQRRARHQRVWLCAPRTGQIQRFRVRQDRDLQAKIKRSEERRVGKECRYRRTKEHKKKKRR